MFGSLSAILKAIIAIVAALIASLSGLVGASNPEEALGLLMRDVPGVSAPAVTDAPTRSPSEATTRTPPTETPGPDGLRQADFLAVSGTQDGADLTWLRQAPVRIVVTEMTDSADLRVGIASPCNYLSADMVASGNHLRPGPAGIIQTLMYCPGDRGDQEALLTSFFSQDLTVAGQPDGGVRLASRTGSLVLVRRA
jgi:hypothetical protein